MDNKNIYLGLDIGTDSVGYAVTDDKYKLLKFHGEPAWGSTIFDEGSLSGDRRAFRTARRRLDRRQQRILLLQELFANEIGNVDSKFYIRIKESALYKKEDDKNSIFNDEGYTDAEYFTEYPTIHHLICELMQNKETHDVRLIYLACAWLVAHRGHFLSNISMEHLDKLTDFDTVYENLQDFFTDNGYIFPWKCVDVKELGMLIKDKDSVSAKYKKIAEYLSGGAKPNKEPTEEFPYSQESIIKLLAGGTVKLKDLFGNDSYVEFGSVMLGMDDEKLDEISANLGDDYALIENLRKVYDWAVLADVLGEESCISEAKIHIYDQHKADLCFLKYVVKKYIPDKYDEIFRDENKANYVSYAYHIDGGDTTNVKKTNIEEFSKYLLGILKKVCPDQIDTCNYIEMIQRLEMRTFLPKQKNSDNRVIPYQLYLFELRTILRNAEAYCPFLLETDETGISISDKIESIFMFKVPYFVGPLNASSNHAWIVRKAGKIYPWNFEQMVDLDASEQHFIQRMTNMCSYLPGEAVLPKDSLMYHKFMVLNEINNIRLNGKKISVDLKQEIYNELFLNVKKVTKKKLCDYLISRGLLEKGEENLITGIDSAINSNLSTQIAFRRMMESGLLSESEVERIVERASYAEDKSRLDKWIVKEFPQISDTDRKYILKLKLKDFGRLSAQFLDKLEGCSKETGELTTILQAMWNTNDNLMELLSEKYTFRQEVEAFRNEYYGKNPVTLDERLDEMYVSNAVRRPVYRTLAIVKDVVKAFGVPNKIFIEMTRGASPDQKGKRTKSRKQQILDLYQLCKDEDVRILRHQLEEMGERADNKLQGDKLFLYYMQLGKSMYSGKPIKLEELGTKLYDIDHIYPQAYVKDDSIINNKVLVLSEENGAKSDKYPISSDIREKMGGYWYFLKENGLISEEKYKRLVRKTAFTEEEKIGFINRQLTETSQSTKAVATILGEKYPSCEIVYSKARLASEFRQEFDILKSRTFNDLHHAVDAYLNIVVGNVYNMKFSKQWFNVNSRYSIKTKTLFTHPVICNGRTVWDGEEMLQMVINTARKNTAHFTKYAYFKTGGLFDQMPVSKAEGLVPRKKNLPTEIYGGYNKSSVMFYIPVRYKKGKKNEIIIMSVEMRYGKRFLEDNNFAREYAFDRLEHILKKRVDDIEFPMGMRPWKVNTVLSLDGFRICITGIGSGGKCLSAQPVMQFSERYFWQFYVKKLEAFKEKITNNPDYIPMEEFDKITREKNMELYELYINKYQNTIYQKRINSPVRTLTKGKNQFENLSIQDQVIVLLNIHQTFGRITGGVDLKPIGGASKTAATVNFSSTISNWAKQYYDVRLIDQSVTGLWYKESENLLKLV